MRHLQESRLNTESKQVGLREERGTQIKEDEKRERGGDKEGVKRNKRSIVKPREESRGTELFKSILFL